MAGWVHIREIFSFYFDQKIMGFNHCSNGVISKRKLYGRNDAIHIKRLYDIIDTQLECSLIVVNDSMAELAFH